MCMDKGRDCGIWNFFQATWINSLRGCEVINTIKFLIH